MKTLSRFLLCALLVASSAAAQPPDESQGITLSSRPAPRLPAGSVSVVGGLLFPFAHQPLTSLWNTGGSVSAVCYVHVNRYVALGLGLEAGFLKFDSVAFAQIYPGVTLRYHDLGQLHLFLGGRYTIVPSARLTPYLLASVGAAKVSSAVYQERVNGRRVTYYEIPGRTRLALGAGGGLAYQVSRVVLLELEGKALYYHHDPEVGLLATARLGLRFNIF